MCFLHFSIRAQGTVAGGLSRRRDNHTVGSVFASRTATTSRDGGRKRDSKTRDYVPRLAYQKEEEYGFVRKEDESGVVTVESSWLEMDVRFPFPCTDSFDITYQLRNRGNGNSPRIQKPAAAVRH
ncbi:hypothetical protein Tco_1132943 [Tanacetum coccineum]|uniref:Uncharacterized protein n=1 Tax=Tanacetum coccineum TaxID=301880 RepID=A0ABQ5JG32_9ASTR